MYLPIPSRFRHGMRLPLAAWCAAAVLLSGCGATRTDELLPPVERQSPECPPPARLARSEAEYVAKRRAVVGLAEPGMAKGPLVGLAASGGGMRSAVINVGALQGLQDVRVRDGVTALERADYLSAVSGGSYTASWLVCHALAAPLHEVYGRYREGPFSYAALFALLNERSADGTLTPAASAVRERLPLKIPASADVPATSPRALRMAVKEVGFDRHGFRNSSSYIGDLLVDYGDTGDGSVMPYGHSILGIRSEAPKDGVSSWNSIPYVAGWLLRYPVYFGFNLALNWTPTDEMNWHRPTAAYAGSLGKAFHVPDSDRVVTLRTPEEVSAGAPDFLRNRPVAFALRPVALGDLNPDGCEAPYLIINANLANTAESLSYPDSTPAAHFEFSSRWCGADLLGYTPTPAFGRYVLSRDGDSVVTTDTPRLFNALPLGAEDPFRLSDAVAASGAAVDGSVVPTAAGATMFVLNLNLRYMTRNSHQFAGRDWLTACGAKTANALAEFTYERSSRLMNPRSGSLLLTDGGHFENMGVFALLRRGVPVVGVVDATFDPEYDWDDLHRLIRITLDRGFRWRFDGESGARLREAMFDASGNLLPAPRVHEPESFVYRMVVSPPAGSASPDTVLLWCKMSHSALRRTPGVSPEKLRIFEAYKRAHPEFPQKSTSELSSDIYEWECLRLLGEVMGTALGRALDAELARHAPAS